jgi:predicted metal-dependent peptidase
MNLNDQRQLSEGKIQLAIQRLATKYPFHAAVLERFVLATRPSVQTMAVSVFGDRVHLWHCPTFVLGLPLDQLVGVLLHEVNHVLFNHIGLNPRDYPDEWALAIAADVTVNEFIHEPLPPRAVLLEHFPVLPKGESTDRRYHRLAKIIKRLSVMPLAQFLAQGGRLDQPIVGKGGKDILLVLDEHGAWDDVTDAQAKKERIQDLLADAAATVGASKIPEQFRGALERFGVGTDPGSDFDTIHARKGRLPWGRLLRRYVGRGATMRPDLRRPSRRVPHLVGVVPGRRRISGRPNILAIIDTSSSMTNELLEQISGELTRLAADYRITVVECDTVIHKVYRYRPLRVVFGRGGTDLRPPLERAFLRKHHADLVVYFTDGDGPALEKSPSIPVIWCLTACGEPPARWGRVVRMEQEPDTRGGQP